MVTVRDIMSRDLVTVDLEASVAEVATVMGEHQVGSALVLEGDVPIGIFTERDVLRAVASHFDAPHHRVAQWMSPDPMTIPPDTDARAARDLMIEHGFRHLPVVDDGMMIGVISIRDLFRADP